MNIVEVVKDQLYFSGQIDDWNAVAPFTAIVDMQVEKQDIPPAPVEGRMYIWIPVNDYPIAQANQAPDVKWLDSAASIVEALIRNGNKVLVHCLMGQNRSGVVVAAALMRLNKIYSRQAIELTRKNNQMALWNETWTDKLIAYEAFLGGH